MNDLRIFHAERLFEHIPERLALFRAARRELAGHKYRILAYDLNIAPSDVDILFPAEKSEKSRPAENNNAAYFRGAVVKLQIVGETEPRSRFYIDYFLAFDVVKAVYHIAPSHNVILQKYLYNFMCESRDIEVFSDRYGQLPLPQYFLINPLPMNFIYQTVTAFFIKSPCAVIAAEG